MNNKDNAAIPASSNPCSDKAAPTPDAAAGSGSTPDPTPTQKPSIATAPGTVRDNATFIAGGLGAVKGIQCVGISAGFRKNPQRRDLALIVTPKPAMASGVFTQNIFCAAPVSVSRENLAREALSSAEAADAAKPSATSGARAIVLNSGNANASTGDPGRQTAVRTTQIMAQQLGCEPHQVLVASTGVIGVPLVEDPFKTGIAQALAQLGRADGTDLESGLNAAQAIMTTDTYAKQAAVRFTVPQANGAQRTYTLAGIVKGSGMIQPDMATLLGVFATDAWLTQQASDRALKQVMDLTLNKVTVDSDTSTNDSVFFLATGATAGDTIAVDSPGFDAFVSAFAAVAQDLARQIAYDGEGATKLVTVNVRGAANDADADKAGRSVANSPLVKTAIAGHDANWGRIAMALGKSGAVFAQEGVSISVMDLAVCAQGLPVPFDEAEALRRFEDYAEIIIDIDLGAGSASAQLWTCDLTHGYITINGDYRT